MSLQSNFSSVNYFLGCISIFIFLGCNAQKFSLKEGDIVFQTTKNKQTKLIKEMTHSDITHCGLVFKKNGEFYVIHAGSPVETISFKSWIARGNNAKYKVVRLKQEIDEMKKNKMIDFAKQQIGKPYDDKFQWSNSSLYCSEFIWKVFNSVGITLTEPKKFSDYDLENPEAQYAIKTRHHGHLNIDEKVVTPVDLLKTQFGRVVFDNY